MTGINIDFSEVSDGFETIPEGEYAVVIEKVLLREPKNPRPDSKPYLNYTLKITEPGEFEDRLLWFTSSFMPKALWRMKQVFENLGVYEDEIKFEFADGENNETILVSPALVGLPAKAVVEVVPHYAKEGETQNQVETLVSADGAKGPQKTTAGKSTGKAFK